MEKIKSIFRKGVKEPHLFIPIISFPYHGIKTMYVLHNQTGMHFDILLMWGIILGITLYWILKQQIQGNKFFAILKFVIDGAFIASIASDYYSFGDEITLINVTNVLLSVGAYVILEIIFHIINKKNKPGNGAGDEKGNGDDENKGNSLPSASPT